MFNVYFSCLTVIVYILCVVACRAGAGVIRAGRGSVSVSFPSLSCDALLP